MKKIINIFWIALGIGFFVFFIYKVTRRTISDHLLKQNPEHTKAVIINERNYNGNSRVKLDYTYSYLFKINGKEYTGDSHDTSLKIGDTIEVEYVKDSPNFNKPLHPKE